MIGALRGNLFPNSSLSPFPYRELGGPPARVDFVFQLVSIAAVIQDLIPDPLFLARETGPFDNENSGSFVQSKFLSFLRRQILGANLVSLTRHVNPVHLFQMVIERARQLICR